MACSMGYGVWVWHVVWDMRCGCGMGVGVACSIGSDKLCLRIIGVPWNPRIIQNNR